MRIDGKDFWAIDSHEKKSRAQASARQERRHGYLARVIYHPKPGLWFVYRHVGKKRKKA